MTANEDAFYMAKALKLARNAMCTADPNPHVGCVLVKDSRIIAEGWTQRAGFAHAEADALAKVTDASGATAYVTLEPCSHYGRTPPCCEALIAAGVRRVVAAMEDPNPLVSGRGLQMMRTAGIQVDYGILQEEAEMLNRGFLKRMRRGLPWIYSKLAVSLDGRTAMASGESRWITSAESRRDVHRFRAKSSAIVTGIGTVLHDDPQMDARVEFDAVQPVKVVLDSGLRMPLSAKMLKNGGDVWILTGSRDERKIARLEAAGCKIRQVEISFGRLSLPQVFRLLAEQQINTVWVEAGATLNGALLDSGLVDEWIVYLAPCALGDQGKGLFHMPGLQQMADKKLFKLLASRCCGDDLRLTFSSQI